MTEFPADITPSPPPPQPSGLGTPEAEQITEAAAMATEAGKEIASKFRSLGRRQRLGVAKAFRRQLIPPGRPGRRRDNRITAAHEDWTAGMRGLELYRKHIPGFDRMSIWKRKVKMRNLMEAIRSRNRRERKRKRAHEIR